MPKTARESLDAALLDPLYVEVGNLPNVTVNLRYGTKHNLLNRDVYGGFQRALLHRIAADKLSRASALLRERHPTMKFVIFDALRPQSAQNEFWNLVKGTPQQLFFADPAKGSIHSYGLAIDLGLLGPDGHELDMGTEFDDLTELAGPQKEAEFLVSGELKHTQWNNRKILRSVMEEAGFIQLPHEWWHYDALPASEVRAAFRRCD